MFLFLSSFGLGASRRQTPQRRLNRRLEEWDIFRTVPLLSSDWIIMQLLCKRREWFVFESPKISHVEVAEKKEQTLAGGVGNQLPLSCHTTPAAPLTSFRGASDAHRATAGATHLPHATPQEKGMWPCRILLCLLKCYPNEGPPYTKRYPIRATWK